jgi:RNA polymerase sigma-70 factor (ECF subfamily)
MTPDDSLRRRHSPLIAEAVSGNRAARSALLEVARPLVFGWVAGQIRDLDDAEDVTQEVLLQVFLWFHSFRGDSSLSSWLYMITAREIAGHCRKRARHQSVARAWSGEVEEAPAGPPVLDHLDWVELRGAIRNLACALPPNQMAAFKLVDLEGMKPCEAARQLRQSQAGVRSNLCRARRKVRELMVQSRRRMAHELTPEAAAWEAA